MPANKFSRKGARVAGAARPQLRSAFRQSLDDLVRNAGSVERLAEQLKYSRQTVTNWRNGRSEPKVRDVAAIAERAGVNANWLVFHQEPKNAGATRSAASLEDEVAHDVLRRVRQRNRSRTDGPDLEKLVDGVALNGGIGLNILAGIAEQGIAAAADRIRERNRIIRTSAAIQREAARLEDPKSINALRRAVVTLSTMLMANMRRALQATDHHLVVPKPEINALLDDTNDEISGARA
jgi:transcriptional regulator with XRE-family HTH domain